MNQIAAAADVAVGTLYRHFPTKTDLLAAVIAAHVRDIAEDAEDTLMRVRSGAPAGQERADFLARISETMAQDQAIKTATRNLGLHGDDHRGSPDEARGEAAIGEVIRLGQAPGDIRPDISTADVYLLMSTIPADRPASDRARWLQLVLPGITSARPTCTPHR